MVMKNLNLSSDISETLLIPLYARAREFNQPSPLLIDPIAEHLVQHIQYDFQRFEAAPVSLIGVVLRAAYFDAIARHFILSNETPIVVHLGCGLDTRLQRLGLLADQAEFYQLDTAEVIAHRQDLVPQAANEHPIASCMFETSWMDQLNKKHPNGQFIFILEGVLMYFSPERNQQLFVDLADRFPGAEIHFDVLSRWLSERSYLHDAVRFTKANFLFGLDNDRDIAKWHPDLLFQSSLNLLGFDGWERAGFPFLWAQYFFPALRSSARVVAYLIQPKQL